MTSTARVGKPCAGADHTKAAKYLPVGPISADRATTTHVAVRVDTTMIRLHRAAMGAVTIPGRTSAIRVLAQVRANSAAALSAVPPWISLRHLDDDPARVGTTTRQRGATAEAVSNTRAGTAQGATLVHLCVMTGRRRLAHAAPAISLPRTRALADGDQARRFRRAAGSGATRASR